LRAGNNRIAAILFVTGCLLCLLQVWLPHCFLTGDGPCHVDNAYMLQQMWEGKGDLYSRFYTLNTHFNPNWSSHIILADLLRFVGPFVAEQTFVTAYVLVFISGLYVLLKRLSCGDAFFPLAAFTFVFTHILFKGFYNFSLGVGIMFWCIELWCRYLDTRRWPLLILFFCVTVADFFTHPLPFMYGCMTCGAMTLSYAWSGDKGRKWRIFFRDLLLLVICLLPTILLLLKFTGRESGASRIYIHLSRQRTKDLFFDPFMVCVSQRETLLAGGLAVGIIMLFLYAIYRRYKMGRAVHKYDGMLIAVFVAGLLYMLFPDNMLGGGLFSIRAHFLLILLVVAFIALLPERKLRSVVGIVGFVCFLIFAVIRLPVQLKAANAIKEIVQAGSVITPGSVLLPLNFAPGGKDAAGKTISDANWLFCHPAQYIGAGKEVIVLDNYEANTGYFPLNWQERMNPFYHFGVGSDMEHLPPHVDISEYERCSGIKVNYILSWCFDSSFLNDTVFNKTYQQMRLDYRPIYTSATGNVILFERNR
jgi:hypothetical protein